MRRFVSGWAVLALFVVTGCGGDETASPGPTVTPSPAAVPAEPVLVEAPSPVGGTVPQLVLPGPPAVVSVGCDRGGFEPFLYEDQGVWLGCQIGPGQSPGDPSDLVAAALTSAGASPELTIPGPAVAVLVVCDSAGLRPAVDDDTGFVVECAER